MQIHPFHRASPYWLLFHSVGHLLRLLVSLGLQDLAWLSARTRSVYTCVAYVYVLSASAPERVY